MYRKRLCVLALGVAFVLACGTAASAKVLFEYWLDIGGTNIANDLRSQCSYPDGPSQSELRDNLKSPVDWKDNYGLRARAYVTPPANGYYTFWVSGDDNCQLWLSTDDSAANAKLIAQVAGWTPAETWDWEASQKSGGILLTAGQKYYVEMLMKEGGGGDSVTAAWAGPTIGADPCVIAAEFLTEFVTSSPAFCPNPANGATEWVSPLLQWKGAANAQMHNIFFGTTPDLTAANMAGMMPGPAPLFPITTALTPGATYYWRVDEVAATGTSTGNVWSFTVMPVKAHFPNPSDGVQFRKTNLTVSWTAGQNAVSHTLYGGTDKAAVAAGDASTLIAKIAETSIDTTPLQLLPATTYYWRIDETDAGGAVHPGDVWTFSTGDPQAGAVAEYWDNMSFDGAPKVVKTAGTINFDWGGDVVPGTNSPDVNIPVDKFTCRWSAELQVPVTGTYTLYEASDDGTRLYLNGKQVAWGWWNRGTTEDATAPLDLVAGEKYQLVLEMYENGGGATAFLRWSGPGYPKEIIPQGALVAPQLPVIAYRPSPDDGAADLADTTTLSWVAGLGTVQSNLYFGTDEALVAAGDASVAKGTVTEPSFDPGLLTWGAKYFWKVDAVAADGAVTPGLVWSFSVAEAKVIDSFEAYDAVEPVEPAVAPIGWWKLNGDLLDSSGNGHNGTPTGNITFEDDPIMGTVLSLPGGDDQYVAIGAVGLSGNMPTTIACWAKADNTNIPDWTLVFGFTGTAAGGGDCGSHFNIDSIGGPGGVGAHAWCWEETIFTDQEALEWRHYAMTYDGTTILYYGDGLGKDTDTGKSNVMNLAIRGDRVHIGKRVTQASSFPGNVADARVYNYVLSPAEIMSLAGYAPNLLSNAWTTNGTVTAAMDLDVAHRGRSMKLDYDTSAAPNMGAANLSFEAPMDLTRGGAQVLSLWILGDAANAPETLSLILEDSAGALAIVGHPNPAVTQMGVWWKVNIPLASFTGANLKAIVKLSIGIGTGKAGGKGTIYVDDIQVANPTTVISEAVRANGQSGNRDPIGAYDGNTTPLANQAGGLLDGNFCYSDRTYKWTKTPFELMGSEYVRTFNSDKNPSEKDVSCTVTISRPTIVFLTIDDRIPAEWNAGGAVTSPQAAADYVTAPFADPGTFVDTGLDLFIGGDSDRKMSVYAAELGAGTYVFGPMWSDKDFYTIGAVK